jgi:drug/metabolite transporter (DMT)-like permease
MNSTLNSPDRFTPIAFFLAALFGGGNSVAIRFSNMELAPFWGAALRFILAGILFWLILWVFRIPVPAKRDAIILSLIGFFTLGVSFGLFYWGMVEIQASLGAVIIALGPLLTFLFAILHRTESFRWQTLFGGLIALAGIAIAASAQFGGDVPVPSLFALILGSAIGSEGNVILKMYAPKSHPIATNAFGMTTGMVFLLICSIVLGESRSLPALPATWMALVYVVLFGSVVMFYLYLVVLSRWSASATSYIVMLFPIVATVAGSILAGETITLTFVFGGALVLIGVWVGALMQGNTVSQERV